MTEADVPGVAALYERHAHAWARERAKSTFPERAWLDRFLDAIPSGSAILDLGCGSGIPIAHYLLEHGFRVTGIDASRTMIDLAHERTPGGAWHVADMRTADLASTFAGVLAWDSFFHLGPDDQRAMFAVFRKHAAEGTILMFTSGPSPGEAIGSLEGEPLYHASLAGSEYRSLLETHGFEVLAHVAEDPECAGRTVWLARLRS